MTVAKERFDSGLTYDAYKEAMTRNRDRLLAVDLVPLLLLFLVNALFFLHALTSARGACSRRAPASRRAPDVSHSQRGCNRTIS